jgi:hypothetical protein
VLDEHGSEMPAGLQILQRWPDGSAAWLLVHLVAPPAGGVFGVFDGPPSAAAVQVEPGGARPSPLLPAGATIEVTLSGRCAAPVFTEVDRRSDAVSTIAEGRARLAGLSLELRTTTWPALDLHRLEIVVHNPRAARHRGGLWDLGDPGSVLIEDVSLLVPRGVEADASPPRLQPAPDVPEFPLAPGEALFQASSGGERWDCVNHVAADGRVPLAFRGWRAGSHEGLRAQPVLRDVHRHVALSEFWQNFPKTLGLNADAATLRLGLFPREHGVPHELQGGERKRHTAWLGTGARALDFVAVPRRAVQPPAEIVAARVLPGLGLPAQDPPAAAAHAAIIVDPERGFAARREVIDEYGWRNWGDFFADHEAVRHTGPEPFVSHYNNQYDGVEACLLWFLRTGDRRWFDLADPLARHVIDIDLYHTTHDRPAYAGGQFWHTDHYRPARTATHRCYSRRNAGRSPYGGGPGNEQNYPSGLHLYHLLTGDPWARAAGLQLAEWVHAMDDGSATVFGIVDAGPTGLASQTYSPDFHGPGRGAGNSVNALLEAWQATGDRRHLTQAEALITRCVHPEQDLAALELLDAERRWSYVVFLKYLLKYLHLKAERDACDAVWRTARASLLHYVRFMVAHEGPSTSRPERLEFVTETWPAQDLRKAQVVHLAAAYAAPAERARYHAWADQMFDRALSELLAYPTADRCRPLVLLLHPTITVAHARQHPDTSAPGDPEPDAPHPPFEAFAPQKSRVRSRLRSASGVATLTRDALASGGLRRWVSRARSLTSE